MMIMTATKHVGDPCYYIEYYYAFRAEYSVLSIWALTIGHKSFNYLVTGVFSIQYLLLCPGVRTPNKPLQYLEWVINYSIAHSLALPE